jgi:N-formylmaleamate deformylase
MQLPGVIDKREPPAAWYSDTCRANGIDVNYRRSGGDKPALIGLHGLLGSGACLMPLARTLQPEFDVVLPDARGHGASSAPQAGYLYDDLAHDVVALIEQLRLSTPVLMGHSMGGMTAAVAASLLGPAITALVLIDPTFISPDWQREVFESGIAAEHELIVKSPRDDLIAQARLRSPNRSAEVIEHLVDARLHTSLSAFEVLTPPNPDWRGLVERLSVPTLLLIGDRGVVAVETARELESLNSLLRFELIANAGHGLPYDIPGRVGAAVSSFLAADTACRIREASAG